MQDFNLGKNGVMSISEAPVQGSIPKLTTVCRRFICGRQYCQMIRVMKCTFICLLVFCLHVHAGVYSQAITFSGKNVSLKKVFTAIEKQTAYVFFYNDEILVGARPVTLNVKNASIQAVLDVCLQGQQLEWSIEDKTVFITKKASAKSVVYVEHEQLPIDVTGRVTDEQGNPLVGANVRVKGSDVGVVTDKEGRFKLENVQENAVLEVSFVGHEMQTIQLRGQKVLAISLMQKLSMLDETVVIAYGTTSKRLNTGNVSSITESDIKNQPVSNPLLTLQGRMPGVFIQQSSGMPGGGINIQIRGQNSISNGNDPFYIIDGVPYTSQLLPNLGTDILQRSSGSSTMAGGNPLHFIDPNDIESITVLKDADATAIYGSRGANGVVLITTKRGKSGKTSFGLNLSTGIGQITRKLDLLTTEQYLAMRREAFKNDGAMPTDFDAPDLLIWDSTRNVDWQEELIGHTSNIINGQASISGGNANTQFLIGANFRRETTVFPGNFSNKKGGMHFNIITTSNNQRFKAALTANYMVDNKNFPNLDLTSFVTLPPNAPEPLNPDGTLNWANSTWPVTNPLSLTKRNYNSLTNNLVSNINLSFQILDGLTIKTNVGYTNMQVDETSTFPIASQNPAFNPTGSASYADNTIQSWIVEPQATYQNFFSDSKIEVLVGTTFQQNKSNGKIIDGTSFTTDLLLENIQAAPRIFVSSLTNTVYKYTAVFARVNYNLKNSYILNLTGRRDGSSRFGDNNKFHSFGSVGAAWLFNSIIQPSLAFVSYGKLRASYGTTGNDQIGDYRFYDLYSLNSFPTYQGIVGVRPTSLYNPGLEWENTKKLEFGLELGLVKDRIFISASYYDNRSSNQLISIPIPSLTGFSQFPANLPATVRNNGWEFVLNTTNITSKNFNWKTSFNLSIARNKLLSFPDIENTSYANSLIVGEPITINKVFKLAGVNDTTGIYQFLDNKGDLTYAPQFNVDDIALVNTAPEFYGGLTNTIIFKNFSLDFTFQFTKQTNRNHLFQLFQPPGGLGTNRTVDVLNRWRTTGDNSPFQKFTQGFFSEAAQAYQMASLSDYAFINTSFVRLKNLAFAYQLPARLVQQIKLQNCRIYLNAQNLLTFTKDNSLDPETVSFSGIGPLKVIMIGIDLTL